MTHPITPPPELVYEWAGNWAQLGEPTRLPEFIATRAAQWGADQELEACCEWIPKLTPWDADKLRAARRPKSPSLKQQALAALAAIEGDFNTVGDRADTIRRALEQLND